MYSQDPDTSSSLKPSENQPSEGFFKKISSYDLFAFVPVPVFSPQVRSSKRSRYATYTIGGLAIAYLLFLIMGFLYSNTPKTSQEKHLIGEGSFQMPNISLTVIPDVRYGISLVNQSYYTIDIWQGTLFEGLSKSVEESDLGTDYECKPDWLPKMNFSEFICPKKLGNLKGNLFTSSEFQYIRIDFSLCQNGTVPGVVCEPREKIEEVLNSARLFLFIEQDQSFYEHSINAFKALFYYPKFDQLQRYEIYLENQVVTTKPDYFYRFKAQEKRGLFYYKEKTYVSQLIKGDEGQVLTIWLRLNEEQSHDKKVPETLMDIIGKWGALTRVLIAVGAIYFFRYNRNKFYRRNPDWQHFGERSRSESQYGKNHEASVVL